MTQEQWTAFNSFRTRFRTQCEIWSEATHQDGWLATLQKEAAEDDENPSYPIETPIVYNHTLDEFTENDAIKIILVGDNPGKDEQLAENKRYLVGQAGKLGAGFFRKNSELGIDFRKHILILNKTPIHSAKTKQLSFMRKKGGERFAKLFDETQQWMARETALLHMNLGCDLWLVGYGELRKTGLFALYAEELSTQYHEAPNPYRGMNAVRLYQHFSMNRFSIDLAQNYLKKMSLEDNLKALGFAHRMEILGW